MRKYIILFILIVAAIVNMAADRTGVIRTGMTMLSRDMPLNASDTINASETTTFTITNLQKYQQHQVFMVGLTTVSGTPNVVIRAWGKVTEAGAWVEIGTYITWTTTANNGSISSTTPNNYNYLKVTFIATATAQQTKITVFEVKTSNAYDIPANSGTLTISRATEGIVTIQTADNEANCDAVYRAGGIGALTLGASNGGTTEIASGDWAIGPTGIMTGIGAITADGLVTASAGVSLGTVKLVLFKDSLCAVKATDTLRIFPIRAP